MLSLSRSLFNIFFFIEQALFISLARSRAEVEELEVLGLRKILLLATSPRAFVGGKDQQCR